MIQRRRSRSKSKRFGCVDQGFIKLETRPSSSWPGQEIVSASTTSAHVETLRKRERERNMSNPFDSARDRPRRSIFDDDSDDDSHNPVETDPFLSRSKLADSHPAPTSAPPTSHNIASLPSPTALQQDHFSSISTTGGGMAPPSYSTPSRPPPASRPSYESPANDPWSSTPRTNGIVPVAAPNFPRRFSSIQPSQPGETASYLLDADHIDIQKSDEKEGLIGFKHVNYTLASARRGTQVVRRYSDFAWYLSTFRWRFSADARLFDALIKRYPFRQIPLMPPKRFAGTHQGRVTLNIVNGHYLSAESDFVERRRRGLIRFMNSIVRHPVLRDDDIVVAFITVPTVLLPGIHYLTLRNSPSGANQPRSLSSKNSQTGNCHSTWNPVSPQN